MRFFPVDPEVESVGAAVVDAALAVHGELGPGLLEKMYQHALAMELRQRGRAVDVEHSLAVHYRGQSLPGVLRVDLSVDDMVVVEVKAVAELHSVHFAQLMTYLRLSDRSLGYLVNFNVVRLTHGLRRVIRTPMLSEVDDE